ncbi:MAG: hypothetical protein J6O01_08200 [Bacteroidales bacterium]|jgi:uncharacterized tellurite resistance protein B-like protein|nr:hypothetical protein [Bacteroidales bacterium]
MDFSSIEKQSIISLMVGIIEADGWIDDEEIEFAEEVLDAIDCSEDDFDLGQEMPLLPALVTIKNMTPEQKDAVADVIFAVIVSDRVIAEEEAEIFEYVAELTGIADVLSLDPETVRKELEDLASEAD